MLAWCGRAHASLPAAPLNKAGLSLVRFVLDLQPSPLHVFTEESAEHWGSLHNCRRSGLIGALVLLRALGGHGANANPAVVNALGPTKCRACLG